MSLDLGTAALLAGSGLLAGAVNALAGGGTFFTFGALVAAGLPPIVANATSAVAVTPANVASAVAYRAEIGANLRRFAALTVVSLVGGVLGAFILTQTRNESFRLIVPWLLLAATLLFAASPWIVRRSRALAADAGTGPGALALGLAIQFAVSIYGGFFGAGMGIVMLAALAITEGGDYHLVNAAKNLCSTVIQLAAVVMFVASGLVSWPETIVVAIASVVGAQAGVAFGRRVPTETIRYLVIAIGAGLTTVFFLR